MTSPHPSHLFQIPSPFLAGAGCGSDGPPLDLSFFSFENQAMGAELLGTVEPVQRRDRAGPVYTQGRVPGNRLVRPVARPGASWAPRAAQNLKVSPISRMRTFGSLSAATSRR